MAVLAILIGLAIAGVSGVLITKNITGANEALAEAAEAEVEANALELALANVLAENPDVDMPDSGTSFTTVALAGGVALGAILLLR
jgi:Tfp pilus assembly protein FimT